ncbi:class I SAM-dependent methyltransferase [Anabaena catenula]|uniref:Class I SAM-dependent methyltransferase n=1 Tax=Anabaena catenula FACHB-362 TaxID=2692877 RepID=A0ABR8JAI4_9NOST|nr:class I SAM-dependent methyltransferase [Anabaena catenula]MBD2695230.1 class I SAM-dependent methyltransferase [Anabaena catenula FACHB-362]
MLLISLKSFFFWLQRPQLIVYRVRYWVWEKLHPDEPWMCPGTVEFCKKHLAASMSVLEFGSGRSSAWFARRVSKITSIEYDENWYKVVKSKLEKDNIANVNLRLILLDHPVSEPEQDTYKICPSYVAVLDEFADESLDLVIVDGHYRTNCARKCLKKIKAGGYLLVDDTNLWTSLDALSIPPDWKVVDQSTNGIKTAAIWQKPLSSLYTTSI